jgi:hypothetical protein
MTIRTFMDEVSHASDGKQITMLKRRKAGKYDSKGRGETPSSFVVPSGRPRLPFLCPIR